MDLPYPSEHDVQLTVKLNQAVHSQKGSLLGKDSLIITNNAANLSARDRTKISRFIEEDQVTRLHRFLKKNVISFYSEIGKKNQTMLHCCAKHNAKECTLYILRTEYQNFPQAYEGLVNAKTADGMTPAMLAASHFSNDFLQILLECGGIDIYTINCSKMTAYQMAMNAENQRAIKAFMNYQSKNKKCQIINKEQLLEPYDIDSDDETLPKMLFSCFISCLTCGSYSGQSSPPNRKFSKKKSILNIDSYFVDQVALGADYAQHGKIEWRPACQEMQNSQALLFDTFSPFDICEKNHSIKNILIILQSLSQHPWLIRKVIQPDRGKNNYYNISLTIDGTPKLINTDYTIPFILDKNQPLFLSDKKEMWPVLLQKALAKGYGSYKALEDLTPLQIIKSITSWNTISQPIQSIRQPINYLQKLTEVGYMFVLEGKKGSYLTDDKGDVHCFTVLNFYNKGGKRMVLVNCPFIDSAWVEKEKHQILALKLIKSHYNSHNQMCIWIEEDKFKDYFSNVMISTIMPNYQKNSTKFKGAGKIFFRFAVQKSREDQIMMQLVDCENKEVINLNQGLVGWVGADKIVLNKVKPCLEQIAHIQCQEAEYFCMYDLKDRPLSKYTLVTISTDSLTPQFIEDGFAVVEWLNCCKDNMIKSWEREIYKIQTIDGVSLLVTKQKLMKRVRINLGVRNQQILQGKYCQGKVEMLKHNEDYYYCVVKKDISEMKIQFSDN